MIICIQVLACDLNEFYYPINKYSGGGGGGGGAVFGGFTVLIYIY